MGKYVVSFNSLEDRASFECLISQMGADWSLSTIDNLRGAWLLITPHNILSDSLQKRGLSMTIERLPREYPIGSTVWTNKGYGTVLVRLGKYHLVWLQRLGLA